MLATQPQKKKPARVPVQVDQSVAAGLSDPQQLLLLRQLLLGKDFQALQKQYQQWNNPELYAQHLATVVTEALRLRAEQDSSLAEALSPTIEASLAESIERDPQHLANSLYPVMGPAIRKSINEVLSQTFETFNQLLEQSLSPKSLLWRFDAWRTGRSYSEVVLLNSLEYQVEQVFLIHRETGLLLRHAVSDKAMSKDPDMISGMLTAIQDFVADSFGVGDEDTLSTMKLGKLTVLVNNGPYAVLAAVVRGNVPGHLAAMLGETQEKIHRVMSHSLQHYEGDSEPFVRIHPDLEKCLQIQLQDKKKKRPWFLYFFLLALLAGLLTWGMSVYQNHKRLEQEAARWQQTVAALADEPGIVVLDAELSGDKGLIRGLHDPLARSPDEVVAETDWTQPLSFDFKPYISNEEQFTYLRLQQALQPPEGVQLSLQNGVLAVTGSADPEWKRRLDTLWAALPGVVSLDDRSLSVVDQEQRDMQRLISLVGRHKHFFEVASADVSLLTDELLFQSQSIRQLLKVAQKQGKVVQIVLVGSADQDGTPQFNEKLANERAKNVYQQLIELGVPAGSLRVKENKESQSDQRAVWYFVDVIE